LREFEEAVAAYAGVPHGVALSSGTAGLQLALEALGIGEGDEVILPSFTFVAVANAILLRRAAPVFADVDARTLNLDPASVEQAITPRTRAIAVVHTFGYPADLDALLAIAAAHGVEVVEDACEAIGAEYRGRKVGGFGSAGVFSFYPNKPITTGEGGVLLTRHAGLARVARALRNQGRGESDGWLGHTLAGYNYRIPDINCALGLSQLHRLDMVLARRAELARRYSQALAEIPGIATPPIEMEDGRVCWFAYVVRLPRGFTATDRDAVMIAMAAEGIETRAYFPPLHLQPLYAKYRNRPLPVTEAVAPRVLALPFFNGLSDGEIAQVAGALARAIHGAGADKPGSR
jgi:dTDP-4-amino-4,6-dideoxygalactose transaminase